MKKLVMFAVVLAAAGLTVLAAPQQGQNDRPTARPAPSPTPEVTLLVATFRDDPNDMTSQTGLVRTTAPPSRGRVSWLPKSTPTAT